VQLSFLPRYNWRMNKTARALYLILGLPLICGFLFLLAILAPGFARMLSAPHTSTPDVVATFKVLISTLTPSPATPTLINVPAPDQPAGRIAFTCQMFKDQSSEQICIMNADGSNYRRLTTEDDVRHFYPSISSDGQSVVYSALDKQTQHFEIYELNLADGKTKALTSAFGDLNAPEISPDGKRIVFTRFFNDINHPTIWTMARAGGDFRQVSAVSGWDPTWSPDGAQILFASDNDGTNQLYVVNLDGTGLKKVTNLPALRGRSDWSSDGKFIVTYSGPAWHRELFIMNADGSNQRQLSPSGGNSQGPSFSPDGKWVAFTAYFDKYNDINGCEIYIVRVDGTDLRRLTNNDYCDYQPRWGP